MIADEQHSTPYVGSPDAELLDAEAFHHAIVGLIEQELPVWRDRPLRPPFQDEPKLNQSLCLHLDGAARHQGLDSIRFVQEGIQAGSRRIDIGVMVPGTITVEGRDYEDFVQLLPIECKRLPTPPDKRRSDCEYVHGLTGHRTGAIERFKHGLHGPANQRAMIIAYVQDESFKQWETMINQRLQKMASDGVDDDLWTPAELLLTVPTPPSAFCHKFRSYHRRLQPPATSPHVGIEHLWLLMN
jgi:hypothetical protein